MDIEKDSELTPVEIAEVNDFIRKNIWEPEIVVNGVKGRIVTTPAVMALGAIRYSKLFEAVSEFDTFNDDNNPYGERDSGSIAMFGETWLWKFDYYNETLDGFGHHTHVLTVMNATEY